MDLKLITGIMFIGAGIVIVAVSQFMTIGEIFRFPLT
jgi:hypothetical protein|tara:strand:+ start:242 stop:352 length:111 start_codon:yes stop_codon:yes gene_type:complete